MSIESIQACKVTCQHCPASIVFGMLRISLGIQSPWNRRFWGLRLLIDPTSAALVLLASLGLQAQPEQRRVQIEVGCRLSGVGCVRLRPLPSAM